MSKKMFDFVIGNPPYQEENDLNPRQPPVYHIFMDFAFELGRNVELITPARFLFGAGQTPKVWNEKMLSDSHFKVLKYEPDATLVFPNTIIKGGVVITYRNSERDYGPIGTFTQYPELNSILQKVRNTQSSEKYLDSLVSSQGFNKFSTEFFKDYPEASTIIGAGTGNKIVSNVVNQMPEIFLNNPGEGKYIQILSKGKAGRKYNWIKSTYIEDNPYIYSFNVALPEANGEGAFCAFSSPQIMCPGTTVTDTFLCIGKLNTEFEAQSVLKYIKTKFTRAMVGIKKGTHHNPKSVWVFVPLQDFTADSDIDWTKSVQEIDRQLYMKYKLSAEEIEFIESHVQEMN